MDRAFSNFHRIVVVGMGGSGKTTFAEKLAKILCYQHIELDALHWGPNWTPRSDFTEMVRAAIAADQWVIDGNYRSRAPLIWQRATTIVWLNYPFHTVFLRALTRTIQRVLFRKTLYSGNRESWPSAFFDKDAVPWGVVRTYHKRRREFPVLLRQPQFQHLALFELRSPAQAVELLEAITAAQIQGEGV